MQNECLLASRRALCASDPLIHTIFVRPDSLHSSYKDSHQVGVVMLFNGHAILYIVCAMTPLTASVVPCTTTSLPSLEGLSLNCKPMRRCERT